MWILSFLNRSQKKAQLQCHCKDATVTMKPLYLVEMISERVIDGEKQNDKGQKVNRFKMIRLADKILVK